MWDGTAWTPLGTGVDGPTYSLANDANGNLFVGGQFTTAGSVAANNLALWNGAGWSTPGQSTAGGNGLNGSVSTLLVDSSGAVTIGGNFTVAGNIHANHLASWNGRAWSPIGTTANDAIFSVNALANDAKGNLYAGGDFSLIGGVSTNAVAKWNGRGWSDLGGGIGPLDLSRPAVYALAIDGAGNIYVAGSFMQAGSVQANNIAKWDGNTWNPLGIGTDGTVLALAVDKRDTLYVGGQFTTAGGVA